MPADPTFLAASGCVSEITRASRTATPYRTVELLRPVKEDIALVRGHIDFGRSDPDAPLIPDAAGQPRDPDDYKNWRRRQFRPAVRDLGLSIRRPYDLRHTCASLLIAAQRNILEIATQLGHRPEMTLRTYGPPDRRVPRPAADRHRGADPSGAQILRRRYNGGMLPQPVIVDADVLLRDVGYVAEKGYLSALLAMASPRYTLITGVALFTTPRVVEEVARHLPEVARRTGRTEEAVVEVWTTRVLPRLRVVDVREDAMIDARVESVRAKHATDAPTAALTVLLAPAVLATDNHRHFSPLIGSDPPGTVNLARDLFEVGATGSAANGTILVTKLGWLAITETARKLTRAIGGPQVALLGLAVSGAVAIAVSNGKARGTTEALRRVANDAVPPVVAMLGRGAAAGERIAGFTVERVTPPDALSEVSRFLAASQTTMTTTEIAGHLRDRGYAFDEGRHETTTRVWLRREPSFVEVARGHWALGYYADEPAS